MRLFEKIAEEKIREAIQNGELDDLPGKGRPLDLDDYFRVPAHLRVAYHLLKNAGVLPQEVQLMREIAALKEEHRRTRDERKAARLADEISIKSTELQIMLERYRRIR
ncbi:MAG: DUF1992 domain-containing protein [Calditrichaeota bacterium]|nr:MAG: DUF1992 domain-containing protein [Calditrichota bacterium]